MSHIPYRILALGLLLLLSAAGRAGPAPTPPAAAVATAHPLATEAGMRVLEAGGNAFDAAVAVTAALAVVEPYSSGLGGGGFWLLHRAVDGRQVMLDGRETAPAASRRDMYLDPMGQLIPGASLDGPFAAGIPGTPAAMVHLAEHYGRLPLAKALVPAISLAREGFEVNAHYRRMAELRKPILKRWPAAGGVFLDQGEVPAMGYRIRQPRLAETLEALAAGGRAGFYEGPVAEALVNGVRQAGGIWSPDDLAGYRVLERKPVSGHYRGWKVVSASPPSSGGVALVEMLNILSRFPLEGMDPVSRVHLPVEAMRLAYRDRSEFLGDPDRVYVPINRLTDPEYGARLARGIPLNHARSSRSLRPGTLGPRHGWHTSHFSILDRQGNRVAATMSINYPFGSGFMPAGTGVLLNDEMDDFSVKPGVPNLYGLVGGAANAIEPGKRPLSSMSPTFVEGPDGVAILGTPGGSRIISTVLLGVLDVVAGKGPDSWVSRPRFHHQYLPDVLEYEPDAFPDPVRRELERRGHQLKALNAYGNMQAVFWDLRRNRVSAASDPRAEGEAGVR